jgi:hypothetical protein
VDWVDFFGAQLKILSGRVVRSTTDSYPKSTRALRCRYVHVVYRIDDHDADDDDGDTFLRPDVYVYLCLPFVIDYELLCLRCRCLKSRECKSKIRELQRQQPLAKLRHRRRSVKRKSPKSARCEHHVKIVMMLQ